MKLSVVIPCYNEREILPQLLESFEGTLEKHNANFIIVDNGSDDGSKEYLQENIRRFPRASFIRVDENKGYGHGILEGLKCADGDFLGWTHGDMQTDPSDVAKAYKLIEKNGFSSSLFVKGYRKDRRLTEKFFSWGMGVFESMYLGEKMNEINAQPTFFHRSFYATWKQPPADYSLDLYAFYRARVASLNILRFDVLFAARNSGHSHWNSGIGSRFRLAARTIRYSRTLKRNNY
jgi:polyisoprenyl-phosphate glycosyltransferase